MRHPRALFRLPLLALALGGLLPTTLWAAGDTQAHPYAYTGFRNNGSGIFPGCTPPTVWGDATATNVLWKVPMPGWTASSPILVDGKLFTLAEPNLLLCVDPATGKTLWQRAVDQTELLPAEQAARARDLYQTWHDRLYGALARYHEAQTLASVLACRDGKPEAAFKDNLEVSWDPTLKDAAVAHARALPDEEIARMRTRLAELQANLPTGLGQPGDRLIDYLTNDERGEWRAASAELARSGYQFEVYYGHVGNTFATPVSDGAHVYVSMGWGQVACYALDGTRQWLKWFAPQYGTDLLYTNSPILVGDKLIVIAGGFVRALDSRTGELIWEQPHRRAAQGHAGSPLCVRLSGVDLIITSHGRIYRASDGKIMADKLPESVSTPAAYGDMVFYSNDIVHGSEGKIRAYGYKLTLTDADTVTAERVWEAKVAGRAGMWTGPVYADGLLYFSYPQNVFVLDAATGAQVINYVPNAYKFTGAHAVNTAIAGGHVYTTNCLGLSLVLPSGRDGAPLAGNKLTSDLQRDHLTSSIADLKAKWWDRDFFPAWGFVMGAPTFAGDRMYVRTFENLYCIGTK